MLRHMSTSNASVIERLYAAIGAGDGPAAAGCYAPAAHFSDPVFPDLQGAEPGAMWRMLAERSSDLRLELLEHQADGDRGTAHWTARYTFSQTGRPVVNDVHASMRFADGLIVEHRDEFDFHRWARQALGPAGLLLGWTPLIRGAVRRRARASLDQFIAQESKQP
jgi:ketosteroid isomerase-like protein